MEWHSLQLSLEKSFFPDSAWDDCFAGLYGDFFAWAQAPGAAVVMYITNPMPIIERDGFKDSGFNRRASLHD